MKANAGKKYTRNKMKQILILAAVLCSLCGSVVVEAAEADRNPIRVDNFTGETITNTQTDKNEVVVYSNCTYDKEKQKFIYTVDASAGLEVSSSVADGMITNNNVSLNVGKVKEYELFRDGTKINNPNYTSIKQVGNYVLQHKGKKVLEFRIIGDYSTLELFYTPKGCYISNVLLNGASAKYSYDSVELSGEGTYEVSYVCEATGRSYSFKTIIDRTAPELAFQELDEKGRARGPVEILNREANSTIKIVLDGEEQKAANILTKSGEYTVTIMDQAGNSNQYEFTIMIYFNSNSLVFLGLILAVAGGILAYIIISAKNLRVF
jgi:hypothetical protein